MNPLPFTVNANADPPAIAAAGDSAVMLGTGFMLGPCEPPPHPVRDKIVPQMAPQSVTRPMQFMFFAPPLGTNPHLPVLQHKLVIANSRVKRQGTTDLPCRILPPPLTAG